MVIAALALVQSWSRWLHPLIDAGRDLYLGAHLLRDVTLYADVAYVYPPLAPHLLAVVTMLFGVTLTTYAVTGIVTGLAVAALLYALARRYAGVGAAFATSLVFVATCLTGATTYGANYVFPYSYAATIGLGFFLVYLLAVAMLVADGPSLARFVIALLAGTGAAWCKLEFALLVVVTGVTALGMLLISRRISASRAVGGFFLWAGALAAPFVVARAAFGARFLESVLPGELLGGPVARVFYEKVTGLDRWRENLAQAMVGAFLTLLHAALVRAIDRAAARDERGARRSMAIAGLLVLLALVVFVLANDRFFRGWLLLQAALVPFAFADLHRARVSDDSGRGSLLLMPLLLAAAAASTSRIWLNLSPSWYGFVFVVPVLPLIAVTLFRYLPSRSFYSRRASLLWIPLFIVIAGRELDLQRTVFSSKTAPIYTTQGRFFDSSDDRARAVNGLLERLAEVRAEELVVIPEGLTINYAANVRTPLRINTFTPAELPTPELERAVAAEIERVKPAYVAVTTQEAAAFGFRGFGIDYGLEIDRSLRANYVLDQQWRSPTFSIFLLRRR